MSKDEKAESGLMTMLKSENCSMKQNTENRIIALFIQLAVSVSENQRFGEWCIVLWKKEVIDKIKA